MSTCTRSDAYIWANLCMNACPSPLFFPLLSKKGKGITTVRFIDRWRSLVTLESCSYFAYFFFAVYVYLIFSHQHLPSRPVREFRNDLACDVRPL